MNNDEKLLRKYIRDIGKKLKEADTWRSERMANYSPQAGPSVYTTKQIKMIKYAEDRPELLASMKDWLKELSFRDIDEPDEIDDEPTIKILNAVGKNYDGGLKQFIIDFDYDHKVDLGDEKIIHEDDGECDEASGAGAVAGYIAPSKSPPKARKGGLKRVVEDAPMSKTKNINWYKKVARPCADCELPKEEPEIKYSIDEIDEPGSLKDGISILNNAYPHIMRIIQGRLPENIFNQAVILLKTIDAFLDENDLDERIKRSKTNIDDYSDFGNAKRYKIKKFKILQRDGKISPKGTGNPYDKK